LETNTQESPKGLICLSCLLGVEDFESL